MEGEDLKYWINVALGCAIRYREDNIYYMENSDYLGIYESAKYKKAKHELCKLKKAQQEFNKNYKKSFVSNIKIDKKMYEKPKITIEGKL